MDKKYCINKKIAVIALIAALLSIVKLALSFIPNVECVTLIIAVFTSVFGIGITLPAVLIFVANEILIYGIGTWVISYFVYWPLLTLGFGICKKFGGKDIAYMITAIIFTIFFGVLTSLIDTGLFTGFYENFFNRFTVIYIRGIVFYIVHIISNSFVFIFLFSPFKRFVSISSNKIFIGNRQIVPKSENKINNY